MRPKTRWFSLLCFGLVFLLIVPSPAAFAQDPPAISVSGSQGSAIFGDLLATAAGSAPALAVLLLIPEMTNTTASAKASILWAATSLRILTRFAVGPAAEQSDGGVRAMRLFMLASSTGLSGLWALSASGLHYWPLLGASMVAGIGGTAVIAMGNIHYWSPAHHSASLRNFGQALSTLAPSTFLMGMALLAKTMGTTATLGLWTALCASAAVGSGFLLRPSPYHQNLASFDDRDALVSLLLASGLQESFPPPQSQGMLTGIVETLGNFNNIPLLVSATAAQGIAASGLMQWLPSLSLHYGADKATATAIAGLFGLSMATVQSLVGPLGVAQALGGQPGANGARLVNVGLVGIAASAVPLALGHAPSSLVGAASLLSLAASAGLSSAGILQWLAVLNQNVGAAGGIAVGFAGLGSIVFLIASSTLVDSAEHDEAPHKAENTRLAYLRSMGLVCVAAVGALLTNTVFYALEHHQWLSHFGQGLDPSSLQLAAVMEGGI